MQRIWHKPNQRMLKKLLTIWILIQLLFPFTSRISTDMHFFISHNCWYNCSAHLQQRGWTTSASRCTGWTELGCRDWVGQRITFHATTTTERESQRRKGEKRTHSQTVATRR